MQKAGLFKSSLLILSLCFFSGKVMIAQTIPDTLGFNYKLLEVVDPSTEAKLQFTPLISSAIITSWNFGDGSTSTEKNPSHSFNIIAKDTFTVTLRFTLNAKDSTITRKVVANSAFFIVKQDSSLMNLASYKRIFRSSFMFRENDPTLIGNMRFEWSVNGDVLADVSFENSHGQYPNIYYTFEQGGINTVTLKTWNIADPTKTSSFTRLIDIQPTFATKEILQNIPNVFTPNGDQIHDYFEVPTSGTSRLKFMVYSRTGALTYQQEANIIKWDGKTQNGRDLPEGIYFYIIEDQDGYYENAKGFFYIFRGK